ncbi:MAG TPA: hypothetical protein VII21_04925 [Aestuariivirga sp.]
MFNNLFKTLIPLALLPMFAFAQPAQARHLFWWQDDGPDMTQDAPPPPPPYRQVYGAPEYQDLYGNNDDGFDERQYQLYQREMRRRYGYQAELPPDDGPYAQPPVYNAQPRYVAPPYVAPRYAAPAYAAPVLPKPKKIVKTARVAPKTPDATTNTKVASAPPTAPSTKPTTTVDCDKGAAIVSGFGFDNVKTKACAADALAYNAERSGQPFEVSVNPKTGELIAVKKLPAPSATPSATPVKTTNSTRTDI